MKKNILYLFTALLALTFVPIENKATMVSSKTEMPADTIPSAACLLQRLDEIQAIDFSTLERSEKTALRKEVRTIKRTMNDNYGGVYISVGAIIIIVLLLILLL